MAKLPAKTLPKMTAAKKAEILSLRKIINDANLEYHSKAGKKTKLTDQQYDAAKDRLATINPSDPLLKKVGHAPTSRAASKVNLPTFMGSLDKLYVDEPAKINAWLKKYLKSGSLIVTHKMDGISALLTNVKGTLKLYTRGNGSVGTDISHLIPYLKYIPKLKLGQQVRGEIVISKASFKKNGAEFENARNLIAGIANKKGVHSLAKLGEFIVHEFISDKHIPLPRVASQIERMGGKVADYKILRAPTVAAISKLLAAVIKSSKYDVDGIVIEANGERIAIKQENETAVTKVLKVRWQLSRYGQLTPVVDIEPVRLAGVTVKQATGFNAKYIKDNKIGPDALVMITRAGEVIPYIIQVVKGTKPSLPPRGSYEWDGINIVSTDDEDLGNIQIKQIVYFLTTLGVKDFKDRLISILYNAGLDSPEKLIKASPSRFEAAGLGTVQANKLYEALHAAMKTATMPKMMVASNVFPKGFGLTAAKKIWSELGSKSLSLTETKLIAALTEIDGLGGKLIDSFVDNRQKFTAFLLKIKWEPARVSNSKLKLKGVVVCFTGFRDAKLQEYLENNGADVSSTVSKKVTHLIVKDKKFNSDKVQKAKQLGIKIIDANDAKKLPQTFKAK